MSNFDALAQKVFSGLIPLNDELIEYIRKATFEAIELQSPPYVQSVPVIEDPEVAILRKRTNDALKLA